VAGHARLLGGLLLRRRRGEPAEVHRSAGPAVATKNEQRSRRLRRRRRIRARLVRHPRPRPNRLLIHLVRPIGEVLQRPMPEQPIRNRRPDKTRQNDKHQETSSHQRHPIPTQPPPHQRPSRANATRVRSHARFSHPLTAAHQPRQSPGRVCGVCFVLRRLVTHQRNCRPRLAKRLESAGPGIDEGEMPRSPRRPDQLRNRRRYPTVHVTHGRGGRPGLHHNKVNHETRAQTANERPSIRAGAPEPARSGPRVDKLIHDGKALLRRPDAPVIDPGTTSIMWVTRTGNRESADEDRNGLRQAPAFDDQQPPSA
jgi:hypothetical protein